MWPFKKKPSRDVVSQIQRNLGEKIKYTGYTFGSGRKFAVVEFTKPGDSGLLMYFFEDKRTADLMLHELASSQIPALIGSSVVQCTLEEIQREAKKCGASIDGVYQRGTSIILDRTLDASTEHASSRPTIPDDDFKKPYQCEGCKSLFAASELPNRNWQTCAHCGHRVQTRPLVDCPTCRTTLRVSKGYEGSVQCFSCGATFSVHNK